jgi:hypothetical protein
MNKFIRQALVDSAKHEVKKMEAMKVTNLADSEPKACMHTVLVGLASW